MIQHVSKKCETFFLIIKISLLDLYINKRKRNKKQINMGEVNQTHRERKNEKKQSQKQEMRKLIRSLISG